MIRWLHSHPLTGFVVLAYVGSWVFWVPFIPLQRLIPTQSYNYAAAGVGQLALLAGPFLASLIMTRLTTGSLRAWVSSFKRWRVPPASYASALIAIPVVIMAASAVLPGKEVGTPSFVGPAVVIGPLIQAVAFLIGGPIQEEVGWRGFALPILQERLRPLQAARARPHLGRLVSAPVLRIGLGDSAQQRGRRSRILRLHGHRLHRHILDHQPGARLGPAGHPGAQLHQLGPDDVVRNHRPAGDHHLARHRGDGGPLRRGAHCDSRAPRISDTGRVGIGRARQRLNRRRT